MKPEVLERLPDWPARMTSDVAARYMGVSQGTFLKRFGECGVREEGNVLWARAQLDHLIAKQFRISQPVGSARERDDSWDDFN